MNQGGKDLPLPFQPVLGRARTAGFPMATKKPLKVLRLRDRPKHRPAKAASGLRTVIQKQDLFRSAAHRDVGSNLPVAARPQDDQPPAHTSLSLSAGAGGSAKVSPVPRNSTMVSFTPALTPLRLNTFRTVRSRIFRSSPKDTFCT